MSKNISNLQLETLDKTRQDLLKSLIPVVKDFVLGGGTALSLQIAHRLSFDFDFFSEKALTKNLLETASKSLSIENIVVDTTSELTFFTKADIKITFLHYPFKEFFKDKLIFDGLALFSVEQIAYQKAYTVGRRGEYRDYFDLYSILINGYIPFSNLISQTKKIYESVFDEKMFLQQLVYFDDLLNLEIIPTSNKQFPDPENIKKYFEKLVAEYIA